MSKTEPKTTDQQTKEEYITECVTGGKTKEECETAWNEAHQAGDYATLIRKYELLKAKDDENVAYLAQATRIIKHYQEKDEAEAVGNKHRVAVELERDSHGNLKYAELMKESPESLDTMKRAIDAAKPKDFLSVSAQLDAAEKRKEPMLSVGEWDPVAKKWKGGS